MSQRSLQTQFHWYVVLAGAALGLFALFLFWWSTNTAARALFLLFGSALTLGNLLRLLSALALPMPEGHLKRFSGGVGIMLTAIFLLLHAQSLAVLALAWVLLVYGLLGSASTLQRLLLDAMAISALKRSYERQTPLLLRRKGMPFPIVYVVAEPGLGVFYGNRLAAKLANSLIRHRRGRTVFFLISESLRRYPEEFHRWVVEQAAAILIVRLPKGYGEEEFDERLRDYYRRCVGKIFLVEFRPRGYDPSAHVGEADEIALSASLLSITPEAFTQHSTVATFADEMAMSTFPIADADSLLPSELHSLIPAIARQGLPPFANSYLRYRLAQSNVERFLCLLECVEVLIRCSVIVLLVGRWSEIWGNESDEVAALLSHPTVGLWTDLLRRLLPSAAGGTLQLCVSDFWRGRACESASRLIDAVNDRGLTWQDKRPKSYLGWLSWFVWLRNRTRGHGTVKEEFVTGVWRDLNETCLRMASGLGELILSSALTEKSDGRVTAALKGWERLSTRADGGVQSPVFLVDSYTYLTSEVSSFPPLLLHPFVVCPASSTLLWDSMDGKIINYLNYGSGQLQKMPSDETNPYNLWRQAAQHD